MKQATYIICGILVLSAILAFFVYTPQGSKILVHQAVSHYIEHEKHELPFLEGNIFQGIRLENFELREIKGLPKESSLRIQKLYVQLGSWDLSGLTLDIENARLRVNDSDPIVLNGHMKDGYVDFNLFGPSLGLNEIKDFIDHPGLKSIEGTTRNIDIFVQGVYSQPDVKGSVFIDHARRKNIQLRNLPLEISVQPQKRDGQWIVAGSLAAQEGEIVSRNTTVFIKESVIRFDKDTDNPSLDLKGESKIENVLIQIRVTGTKKHPDIQLSSQPSLPKENLLVMLATGKRWQSVENTLTSQTISPDLASDFIDYFFFGGQGQRLAKAFGIKEINVTYNQEKQGIGIKKAVTDKLDVGYGVEKSSVVGVNAPTTTQKVEGEYKFTESLSVEVGKKFESQDKTSSLENTSDEVQSEDKVLLKFQRNF